MPHAPTCEVLCLPGQVPQIHILCQGHVGGVDPEDLLPGLQIRRRYVEDDIKAAGPDERRVQSPNTVCGGQHEDAYGQ